MTKIGIRTLMCLSAIAPALAFAAPYADTVVSFTGGSGFGVVDGSGGSYAGVSGPGIYDPLAITGGLDGAFLGLGGEVGTPGSIVVRFSSGVVLNGAGADVRFFDTFLWSEGLSVEASSDGTNFVSLGSFGGAVNVTSCSLATPCATDFDLGGMASASYFRVTVVQGNLSLGGGCVTSYPECYDLDAVEALYFRSTAVPTPGALALMGLGLTLIAARRRRR